MREVKAKADKEEAADLSVAEVGGPNQDQCQLSLYMHRLLLSTVAICEK